MGHPVTAESAPHLLVVDDDPSFGKILQRIARQAGVRMTVCQNAAQLLAASATVFSAALIDFDLGHENGLELAARLPAHTPVLIISQSQPVELPLGRWPQSVRGFLHKSLGHFALFEAALAASDSRLSS